jgi:prephenate dehydrogenase
MPALRRLAAAGAHVASIHPMFGPSATVLRGHDVVLCRTGDAAAEQAMRDLFAPTSARLVELGLDEHDRLVADVLALAHATALAFAAATGPAPAAQGTTHRRLQDVAAGVVRENPQVYYEVQAGNPHAPEALARLAASLQRVRACVDRRDPAAFAAILDDGRRNLEAA